jgi:tetratricopeptide (TPR) repeat protein
MKRLVVGALLCLLAVNVLAPVRSSAAEAPTTAQALSLTPIQPLVEFDTPTKEEAAQCTMRAETENNQTAWIVRDKQGQILRRFADANGDNFVDLWCYYQDGLEVYRDIDSNFNKKADQYRWFNTAGTRWGVDKDEDGRVDLWRVLSSHEVAEQVVFALKTRDPSQAQARFALLLLTPAELNELGLGKDRADQIAASVKNAPAEFSKLLNEQKIVSPQSRYMDFGSARPATIPSGTGGSTKDVVVIDNASALVETGGKHEQVLLGTLVSVGGAWKLIGAPAIGGENQPGTFNLLTSTPPAATSDAAEGGPSDEMQKLMAELERLDRESDTLSPDKQAANIGARADALQRLAKITPEAERDQWYRQLADMLSVAAQSGNYPQGIEKLEQLQQSLTADGASNEAIAHAVYQRLWAQYTTSLNQPGADAAKEQEKWLAALQGFVDSYPTSADSAEALLQLGLYQEFLGKSDEAVKSYQRLVKDFPKAAPAQKGNGALRRLGSVGKPIQLRGNEVTGTGTVDLGSYRKKVTLIHYWATWCEPCKEDMVLLRDFHAKRGGRDFDIIGVCLDSNGAAAKQYLAQNRFPWKHIHEPGGLDGRLALELGIMTPPHMILVDQNGNVVNNNIHVPDLEPTLTKLLQPAANTATTPRTGAIPR